MKNLLKISSLILFANVASGEPYYGRPSSHTFVDPNHAMAPTSEAIPTPEPIQTPEPIPTQHPALIEVDSMWDCPMDYGSYYNLDKSKFICFPINPDDYLID